MHTRHITLVNLLSNMAREHTLPIDRLVEPEFYFVLFDGCCVIGSPPHFRHRIELPRQAQGLDANLTSA